MGVFGKTNSERGQRGGVYFLPSPDIDIYKEDGGECAYRVRVDRLKADKTREVLGKSIEMFIAECTVISSEHPKRPPGSHPSAVIKLDKDAALGNVADICRSALSALCNMVLADGEESTLALHAELERWKLVEMAEALSRAAEDDAAVDEDDVHLGDGDVCDAAITKWIGAEENPLGGVELDVVAFNKRTDKGKGNPFTRLRWSCPEATKEAARGARARREAEKKAAEKAA